MKGAGGSEKEGCAANDSIFCTPGLGPYIISCEIKKEACRCYKLSEIFRASTKLMQGKIKRSLAYPEAVSTCKIVVR